jgi:HEAT repeat protein
MEHPVSGDLSPGDGEKRVDKVHDRLLAQLSSKDWREREESVEAIVALDDRNLAESVLNLVRKNSADLNAVSAALKTLEQVGRPLTAKMVNLLSADEDADMRVFIPIVLGELGDPTAAAGLIDMVENREQNVNARFNAIEALGKLRTQEAVPLLRQIAANGEPYLRYAAVVALGFIGRPDVEQDLLILLKDKYLAEPAISALGQLGGLAAVAEITTWMNEAALSNSCHIDIAVQALASIARRHNFPLEVHDAFLSALDPQTVSCLPAILEDPNINKTLPLDLTIILSWAAQKYPQQQEVWTALVRLLEDPKTRAVSNEVLRANPTWAAGELISALQNPSSEVAKAAAYLLGELRIQEAGPYLEQALERGEEGLAAQSADSLGRLGRKEAGERLLAALVHTSAQVRRAAVSALAAIQPPGLINQVIERTRHSDPRMRESILRLLALLDDKHGAAVALRSLSDEDPGVRLTAVELLPHFHDPQAAPALAQAMVDPDVNLRMAAARAVGAMPAVNAVPLLQRAARDENGWVRMHATRALSRFAGPKLLPDFLERLGDEFPPVRIAAVDALAGFPKEVTYSALAPLLKDENEEVRESADRVLGKMAPSKGLEGK